MHLLDLQDPKSIGQAGPWFLHQKKPMTDQSTLSLPGHAVVTIVPSWPSSPGGGGVEPAWGLLVLSSWTASCQWFQAEVVCEGTEMKDKCSRCPHSRMGAFPSPSPATPLTEEN